MKSSDNKEANLMVGLAFSIFSAAFISGMYSDYEENSALPEEIYFSLHKDFFEKSTPLFSKFIISPLSKREDQCLKSIETLRSEFIKSDLQNIRKDKTISNETWQSQIDTVKPLISKFEQDCKLFL